LPRKRLQLKAVQRLLPDSPGAASDIVVDLLADARTTAADIRRLVYDLRPPRLDELGLVGALRQQWTVPGAPALVIDVDPGLPELPAAVEVAVYRIATEALQNVVKHAVATKACVVLEGDGAWVRLSVSDDGRGLPTPLIAGVGLAAMRERADELGGKMDVVRQRGWTTVVVELPMRAAGG
jgi:signal transduction histidine kinase